MRTTAPSAASTASAGSARLSIANAASSTLTLQIMTAAALLFTPIVLAYQGWTYWVFRQRLSTHHIPAHAPTAPAGPVPAEVTPVP